MTGQAGWALRMFHWQKGNVTVTQGAWTKSSHTRGEGERKDRKWGTLGLSVCFGKGNRKLGRVMSGRQEIKIGDLFCFRRWKLLDQGTDGDEDTDFTEDNRRNKVLLFTTQTFFFLVQGPTSHCFSFRHRGLWQQAQSVKPSARLCFNPTLFSKPASRLELAADCQPRF